MTRRWFVNLGYYLLAKDAVPPALLSLGADLIDRSLLQTLLRQLRINCVLDVGAHTGSFARNLRRVGYEGHIVSFEPTPASFVELEREFARDPRWRGMNVALGAEEGVKLLHVTPLSNLNSFMSPIGVDITGDVEVPVRRLDAVFDELVNPIAEPRVFLKIDTQGYDVEVVRGATRCLDRVAGLQSEISIRAVYEGTRHYLEALAYYESLGFRLANLCTASRHHPTRNVVEYDCLMYRDLAP